MEQETKTNVGDLRISEAVIVKMANYAIAEVAAWTVLLSESLFLRKRQLPFRYI